MTTKPSNEMEKFTSTMEKFISLVSKRLPDDVMEKLSELRETEDSPIQKVIYDTYFENLDFAVELDRPCCQDTGLLHFYIKAGSNFQYLGMVEECLKKATSDATKNIPLRPNAVNYFEEKITEDGLAERIPWVNWEIVPEGDELEIITYFAGGGCWLPGRVQVFSPSQGYPAIVSMVMDVVTGLGLNACPPVIIGIGLGENIENAAVLSKKAYLRPLGMKNPNEKAAQMEAQILEGVNSLGIGAQGLPGKNYALAVNIEASGRHTATIAVAVNLACYVHRRGVIRFDNDLNYTILNYRGIRL